MRHQHDTDIDGKSGKHLLISQRSGLPDLLHAQMTGMRIGAEIFVDIAELAIMKSRKLGKLFPTVLKSLLAVSNSQQFLGSERFRKGQAINGVS